MTDVEYTQTDEVFDMLFTPILSLQGFFVVIGKEFAFEPKSPKKLQKLFFTWNVFN
jgi:hypothetical protein